MSTIVKVACALRLPCFPVRDDKRPCIKDWPGRAARTPKSVRRLWRAAPGPLIGLLCGESSGLDLLDIDPRNNGARWLDEHRDRLPSGRRHETRSGGLHILFRHSEAVRSTVLASGVDVLADGRFCVWWPAAGFGVSLPGIFPEWPDWLLGMMRRTSRTSTTTTGNPRSLVLAARSAAFDLDAKIADTPPPLSGYTRAALDALFRLVANAPEGTRAVTLNKAAYRLGVLGVPFEAEGMLTRAAIRCGLDTDDGTDIQAVIRCGFEAGSRNEV